MEASGVSEGGTTLILLRSLIPSNLTQCRFLVCRTPNEDIPRVDKVYVNMELNLLEVVRRLIRRLPQVAKPLTDCVCYRSTISSLCQEGE